MQFSIAGHEYSIAVGELPGRKYKHCWRNLQNDLGMTVGSCIDGHRIKSYLDLLF